jgi:cation transport protein ChaC
MPGVVLGLDAGGACRGVAFRIATADAVDVLDYLFERELGGYGVYRPARCTVRLQEPSGTPHVSALCFVVDRSHEQYVGDWSLDDLVTLVRQGQGEGGRCIDYYADALAKLEMLGIKDRTVRRLYAAAGSPAAPSAVRRSRISCTSSSRTRCTCRTPPP